MKEKKEMKMRKVKKINNNFYKNKTIYNNKYNFLIKYKI